MVPLHLPSLLPPPNNLTQCWFCLCEPRWVFEKYDGVRAFWHPLKKAFFSRFGKRYPIPDDMVAKMPGDIFLDGEFW